MSYRRHEIVYLRPHSLQGSDQDADSDGLFSLQISASPPAVKEVAIPLRPYIWKGHKSVLRALAPKRQATRTSREHAEDFDTEPRLKHLAGVEQIAIAEDKRLQKKRQPKNTRNANVIKSKDSRQKPIRLIRRRAKQHAKSQAAKLRDQKDFEKLRFGASKYL